MVASRLVMLSMWLVCACFLFSPLSAQTTATTDRVAQCFGKIFETYVKARLNRLENPIMTVEGTQPLEALFNDLDLSNFSYAEKRQLAFMVLIAIPILDAANSDTFQHCLRPDAARIGEDLLKVNESILQKYFYFDKLRIREYRDRAKSLKRKE